jgi:hypothetical protein
LLNSTVTSSQVGVAVFTLTQTQQAPSGGGLPSSQGNAVDVDASLPTNGAGNGAGMSAPIGITAPSGFRPATPQQGGVVNCLETGVNLSPEAQNIGSCN